MSDFFKNLQEDTKIINNPFLLEPTEEDFIPEVDNGGDFIPEKSDNDAEPIDNVTISEIFDADEVAETAIDMIDGVQTPIFMLLHRKKLVKKYFETPNQFKLASEVSGLEDEEIVKNYPDKVEDTLRLKRKYRAMFQEFNTKRMDVPLSEEERGKLHKPMRLMVKKSGMDIPPGLALTVCFTQIVINRLIDVYWD